MPVAVCPKCGKRYFGWALMNPAHQTCICGAKLEVHYNEKKVLA